MTPASPTRSTLNGSDRRARLVLTAGFLACVVLGIWSNAWGGAPERIERGDGINKVLRLHTGAFGGL